MTQNDDLFRTLYEKYGGAIVSFFMRFGFSRELAQEYAQDTFVRVYEHMDAWRRESEWVYLRQTALRIALNAVRTRDSIKRKGIHVPIDSPVGAGLSSGDELPVDHLVGAESRRDRLESLKGALAALDPRLLGPILLRCQGKSYREIAAALGLTLDTVKTRIHEAKARIREHLGVIAEELDDHDEK